MSIDSQLNEDAQHFLEEAERISECIMIRSYKVENKAELVASLLGAQNAHIHEILSPFVVFISSPAPNQNLKAPTNWASHAKPR